MFFLVMYSLPIFGMSENSVIIEEEKKEKRRYEFVKACKSAGVKKLWIKTADGYAALNERKILDITNKHTEYRIFMPSFWTKERHVL